jgi:hypothetical protein
VQLQVDPLVVVLLVVPHVVALVRGRQRQGRREQHVPGGNEHRSSSIGVQNWVQHRVLRRRRGVWQRLAGGRGSSHELLPRRAMMTAHLGTFASVHIHVPAQRLRGLELAASERACVRARWPRSAQSVFIGSNAAQLHITAGFSRCCCFKNR